MIYLPHLPDAFVYGSAESDTGGHALAEALYVSMTTLATLGYGDVTARDDVLRLVTGLEALVGFALLSGAVTWVLQIAPTLTQRRTLALRLHALRRAGADPGPDPRAGTGTGAVEAATLREVALGLEAVLVGLFQHPESYYFRETVPEMSLAAALPVVEDLLHQARTGSPAVRDAAAELDTALRMLTNRLATTYLDGTYLDGTGDVGDILRAVAADHGEPYGATG